MDENSAISQNTINKLNALLTCNPKYCKYTECPNYYTEEKCCDAMRTIKLLETVLKQKFEGVKTYEI